MLEALELRVLEREVAEAHYAEHAEKPFFGELSTSSPPGRWSRGDLWAQRGRGLARHDGLHRSRQRRARHDSWRHATLLAENVVHGSDSPESAAREIALFFPGIA